MTFRTLLSNVAKSLNISAGGASRRRRQTLPNGGAEILEIRQVPAAVVAGNLQIVGSDAVDNVKVEDVNVGGVNMIRVTQNGAVQNFRASSVTGRAMFWGYGGNDSFDYYGQKACYADGGSGNDFLSSDKGKDLLIGGSGNDTLIGNLRHAAAKLKDAGISLIAEPINFYDIPGFFLNTSAQAIAIFDEVGSDNLKLQYDIYHMQRMEGEIAATLARLMPRIGHVQIADNPGRHEPGTGELNYRFLLAHLKALGYRGWVGAEYKPRAGTEAGLGWIEALDTVPQA